MRGAPRDRVAWVGALALCVPVGGVLVPTSATSVTDEPELTTMTAVVTAEWPTPDLVGIGYTVWNVEGTRPENSGCAVAAWSGGCDRPMAPLTVSVGAPLVDS